MNVLLIDNGTLPSGIIDTIFSNIEKKGEKCKFINVGSTVDDKIILDVGTDLILFNSALLKKISPDTFNILKQRDEIHRTPIIGFSASPSDDEEYETLKAGACDYIHLNDCEKLVSLKFTQRIGRVMGDKKFIDYIHEDDNEA